MKCRFVVSWFLAVTFLISPAIEVKGHPITKDTQQHAQQTDNKGHNSAIVGSTKTFGLDLFHKLSAANSQTNVFLSPLSVVTALTMTLNGSEHKTAEEIRNTLHLSTKSLTSLNSECSNLINALVKNQEVKLQLANGLFANNAISFEKSFTDRCRKLFAAEITTLDFKNPSTITHINKWVSDKTHNKIPHIIDRLDADTLLVLLNAVYFKGRWQDAFEKKATRDGDFHLLSGTTKKVPLMRQSGSFSYYKGADFQSVRLPYGTGKFSAYIFLPDVGKTLAEFQKNCTANNWDKWMSGFKNKEGDLVLPRFKLEYSTSLIPALKELGMHLSFQPLAADFSGMHKPPPPLYIGEATHKTYLTVDEEGTEAAAVTQISMLAGAMYHPPSERFKMVVDRPFLFSIQDDQTGTILFIGSVYEPMMIK
ncbi:MAG: serpin family protein [Candidatus Melainabacteria bacterium]|nr:serpin family protein [Candidatus Melainabacteria bacterium]